MIQITFTEAQIAALEYERYRHPSPQVQKRLEVVYLKSQGVRHQEIARLCRICRQTVLTILHLYQEGGIERLKQFHFAGQPSALNQHQSSLEAHFREGPLTVVLDNARYQKCALVQDYAAALGIELLYLPSFSPHLNLIERLWRFVRKECLYSHYYATFGEFRSTLESCLTTLHRERRLEVAREDRIYHADALAACFSKSYSNV